MGGRARPQHEPINKKGGKSSDNRTYGYLPVEKEDGRYPVLSGGTGEVDGMYYRISGKRGIQLNNFKKRVGFPKETQEKGWGGGFYGGT